MHIDYYEDNNTYMLALRRACIPVVGSSANMTEGLAINSHARDKRFFSPPLIPRTFASPTIESAQLTFGGIRNFNSKQMIFNFSNRIRSS